MTISVVQSAANVSGGSTITAAYSSPVTPGNVLVATLGYVNNARTISSFSDNQFGAWAQAAVSTSYAGGAIYYLATAVSSSVTPTVTVALNSTSQMNLTIMEVSGISAAVDQIAGSAHSVTTSSTVSTSGATTSAVEFVIATTANAVASSTFTQGAGYTYVGAATAVHGSEWLATSSTGVQTATMTWTSAASGCSLIATFKSAGGAFPGLLDGSRNPHGFLLPRRPFGRMV